MTGAVLLLVLLVSVGVWTNNLPAEIPEEPKDIYIDHVDDTETLRKEKMNLMEEIEQLQEDNDNLRSDQMALENLQHLRKKGDESDSHSNSSIGFRPADCADLLMHGVTTSGIYEIYPFTCTCLSPMRVYCDMKTDGGGWTVILTRRQQPIQVNFNRTWAAYKKGFGKLKGEHWLGNDNIHALTGSRSYALRLDIESVDGDLKEAVYTTFMLENEDNKYKLILSSPASRTTPYDCFTYNRNRYFTTLDRDYDSKSGENCATMRGGGYWYYDCRTLPFTGIYEGVLNYTCYTSTVYQASRVQMKVRPTACETKYKVIHSANNKCGC